MKKLFIITAMLALFIGMFSSCKKEEEEEPPQDYTIVFETIGTPNMSIGEDKDNFVKNLKDEQIKHEYNRAEGKWYNTYSYTYSNNEGKVIIYAEKLISVKITYGNKGRINYTNDDYYSGGKHYRYTITYNTQY